MNTDIKEILEKVGVTSESIGRIKLSHGVAGKLCIVAFIVIVALGVLAFKTNNIIVISVSIIIITVFAFYVFRSVLKFANEHPDIALLEGAEFLIYHGKMTLGAKMLPNPPKKEQIAIDEKAIDKSEQEEKER